jgi:type IV secretory pathway VirB2 component (pilin)
MAGVRALPFVLWTALGSAVYSAAVLAVWVTGVKLWVNAPELRWLLIVVLIVGFFGVAVWFGIRHMRGRSETPEDECALK